ncbi:MAG: hypothetical protein ACI8ZB_001066 [Desulforhopalus sp.]|jgi:hypothetical protein
MRPNTSYKITPSIILFITLLILCLFPMTISAAAVTGRYLKASGTAIVLELSVSSPAPSSIIVVSSCSSSNTIRSASPKPKKIDNKNGQVKWLVTNLKPGKKQFSIQLAAPLTGSVQGTIRYRDPAGGQFIEHRIAH